MLFCWTTFKTRNHLELSDMSSESDYAEPELARPGRKAENAMSIDTIAIGDIDERKVLTKIDLRVLPTITVIYVLAFLDR